MIVLPCAERRDELAREESRSDSGAEDIIQPSDQVDPGEQLNGQETARKVPSSLVAIRNSNRAFVIARRGGEGVFMKGVRRENLRGAFLRMVSRVYHPGGFNGSAWWPQGRSISWFTATPS